MENDFYTIPQAAKICAVARSTMWQWVKTGNLKASVTLGGRYRILKEDLESFLVEKGVYHLSASPSSRGRILIVDDDLTIQELLKKTLSPHGYQIEVASDGFEAGVKITEFKPGLVILNLFMPGMDGFEVCKRIKENPGAAHTKILAITGYDSEENRDRIMAAGADGYLAKPVEKDDLMRNIENLLNGKNAKMNKP